MKNTFRKSPQELPGQGNVRNLVNTPDGDVAACPCCGAVWKEGRPWTSKVMTVAQFAQHTGRTQQAVCDRIRKGSISAYRGSGKQGWLIPINESSNMQTKIIHPPEDSHE